MWPLPGSMWLVGALLLGKRKLTRGRVCTQSCVACGAGGKWHKQDLSSRNKRFFIEANQSTRLVCLLHFLFDSQLQSLVCLALALILLAFYGKSRLLANLWGVALG